MLLAHLVLFSPYVILAATDAASPPRKRPAVIKGRVVADGVGIAGIRLVISSAANDGRELAAAISDAQGMFDLKGLPLTLLRLSLEADGFVPLERTLSLAEGEVRWVELAPHRAATLRIRVTGPDGQPIRDAMARVLTEAENGRFFSAVDHRRLADLRATRDPEGCLVLRPLDLGVRHRIALRRDGFAPQSILVTIEAAVVEQRVRLQRAGAIRLAVQDREKREVAGAVADPVSDDVPDLDLLDPHLPSNQDGLLRLPDLPEGTYALRLRASGFRPRTVRGVVVRAGRTTDVGPITLEPGSSVAGRVLDHAGTPVRQAKVRARFYEEGRRIAIEARSDVEGLFRITGLSDQDVELRVDAPGFLPETLKAVHPGSEAVRLVMSRPGRIIGRAVDAGSGHPIPEFSVELVPGERKSGTGTEDWRTESARAEFEDAEGRFEVSGLRPQRYRLIVRARGYRPVERLEVEARVLVAAPITVRLDAGQSIEGVVLDAERDAPIAGAVVRPAEGEAVSTDVEGRFRLGGLDGRSDLQVEHPLYVKADVKGVDPDAVAPLEIRMARGGSVEGTVYGRGGAPLQGAEVALEDDGRAAITDSGGRYRLDGLQPGQRLLRKVDSAAGFEGSEMALVIVRQGETTVHDFGRGTRLYGTITRRGGPASGALMTLGPSDDGITGHSAAAEPAVTIRAREDGSYEARGILPGAYGLTLVWEGQTIVGRRVILEEGVLEQRLDFQIPDLWLKGTLVDAATGSGLRGVVSVSNPAGGTGGTSGTVAGDDGEMIPYSSFPQAQVESDETGRFRVPLMEAGAYSVSALAEGYMIESPLEIDVARSRGDLLVRMVPAITLDVNAVDGSTGASLSPDCVSFFAGAKQTSACGTEPRLDFLRPGGGSVSAYVRDYAPGYRTVELRDGREAVTVSLTRGGTLRLLLPPQVGSAENARRIYGLRLENAEGIDTLLGHPFEFARDGEPEFRHVPSGPLRVRLGGPGSGLPETSMTVIVSEGGETVADLR